jgi:hypothetical protein
MGYKYRFRYLKFFRGLILSSQPAEIDKLVKKYNEDLKLTEKRYLDIIIHSNGALNYQDIMTMPLTSIDLFVERLNHATEEKNKAMSTSNI